MPRIEVEEQDRKQGKKSASTSAAGKNVTESSATPSPYHRSKDEWKAILDEMAATASGRNVKLDLAPALLVGGITAVPAMLKKPANRVLVGPLAARGIDPDFFAAGKDITAEYASSAAAPLETAVREVLTPEDRSRVTKVCELVPALRESMRKVAKARGTPDEIPGGTHLRIRKTVPGAIAGIEAFLGGVTGREALLEEATIGEEELNELRTLLAELQAAQQNKPGRVGARKQKTSDVSTTALAMDAWLKTYETRARVAFRTDPKLLERALAVVPSPQKRTEKGKQLTKTRRATRKQKELQEKQKKALKRQAKKKTKKTPPDGSGSGA